MMVKGLGIQIKVVSGRVVSGESVEDWEWSRRASCIAQRILLLITWSSHPIPTMRSWEPAERSCFSKPRAHAISVPLERSEAIFKDMAID